VRNLRPPGTPHGAGCDRRNASPGRRWASAVVEVGPDRDGGGDAEAAERDPGPGGPAARQGAVNRDGEPKAIQGGDHFGLGVFHRRNTHSRENRVIRRGINDGAEVIPVLDRQICAVARHDQPLSPYRKR